MKDGKFETQAEIYQALLNGSKICNIYWIQRKFCALENGNIVNDIGISFPTYFQVPSDWVVYQEPKQKVKIVAHLYSSNAIAFSVEDSSLCIARDDSKDCKRLSLSFDAEVL